MGAPARAHKIPINQGVLCDEVFAYRFHGLSQQLRMAEMYPILTGGSDRVAGRQAEDADSIMRPSISLKNHRDQVREVLQRFSMANPRIFGSTARGEDTEQSDLDILVDAPHGTSLYDLAGVELELEAILGCKVEVLTKGFLAPDIAERAEADLLPIP